MDKSYMINCVVRERSTLLGEDKKGAITAIGLSDGKIIDIDKAIRMIEKEDVKFYTEKDDKRIYVEVITKSNGTKYLRTIADSKEGNNLERLPECSGGKT